MANFHMEKMAPPYALSVEEVLDQFETSKDYGLTSDKVEQFRLKYGMNTLPQKKKSLWKVYFRPLFNLMTLILLAAAAVNLILYYFFEQSTLSSALIIFGVVFLNFIMSIFQTFRAQKALAALKKLTAFKVTVVRGNERKRIDSSEIVMGDILSLEMGDYIGADARIISAAEFKVDESMLTGESLPVKKHTDPLVRESTLLHEWENMVLMGSFVQTGEALAVVVATGRRTQIGRIAQTLEVPEEKDVPLQRKMNALAKGFGIMVLAAIVVMLIISFSSMAIKGELDASKVGKEVTLAAALAVDAIPVNFPVLTTLILLWGVISLARSKVIVRKLAAIESLGRVSVICTDKTGTLTKNEMTIQQIWTAAGAYSVTGSGYAPVGQILADGAPVDVKKYPILKGLIKAGVASNTAELTTDRVKIHKIPNPVTFHKIIGEPTEGAFLVLAVKAGYDVKKIQMKYPVEKAFPFNSERKRNSVVSTHKGIIHIFSKGAMEEISNICSRIWVQDGERVLTDDDLVKIDGVTKDFATRGMRTLAVAMKTISGIVTDIPEEVAESDLVLLGIVGILDPPRDGVRAAVKSCQAAGIKVVMITGDHPVTAAAIAMDLDFFDPERDLVLTGAEISRATNDQIGQAVIFSRVAPEDKQFIVSKLKAMGKIVAMTGDGVNDALALEKSDAGVAMGVTGTDVAKNAADLILGDDSFATIEEGVFQGRGIFKNIRSCVVYLLTCNLAEMLLIFLTSIFFQNAQTNQFFYPLQLLYLWVTAHFLPVLALMFDKMDRKDLMTQPPKDPKEGITSMKILLMLAIQIGILAGMAAIAFIIGYYLVSPLNIPAFASYPVDSINGGKIDLGLWHGRTLALATAIIIESLVAFNVRSERSIRKSGWNFWVILFVLFTILTAILAIYLPFAQQNLATTPLTLLDWVIAIALSTPMIVLIEIYKKYPPLKLIAFLKRLNWHIGR